MPDTSHYRLDDLKRRWESDPSSRLFLQLADEYRKLGQLAEAIAVLEQGLEQRPNDLSGLVSLGRCRLEIERAADAVAPLETVVARDPTHIVANKLLLEAYLQRGDAEKAGRRLDTYRLLNDRDPELDHLVYRLERLRSEEDEAATVVAEDAPRPEDVIEAPSEEEPAEAVAAEEEPFDSADVEAEPFEAAAREDEPVEAAAFEDEGVEEEAVGATAVEEEPSDVPALEEEPVDEPALELPGSELFQLAGGPPPADLGALWEQPPPAPPGLTDPFGEIRPLNARSHWELLAGEGIFAVPASLPAAEAPVDVDTVPEKPEAPAPIAEVSAAAAPPADKPARGEEAATATLGELYLKQGHRQEAERIFRRVLERDPGNPQALAGLERLADRPRLGRPLTAADLLAVKSARGRIPEGLTAKKVLVLGNYAKHLRAADDRHVH